MADWSQVHHDEARWSPLPEHEYSVSFHRPGNRWVVAYFAPGARTGEWLDGAAPSDDGYPRVADAARAAQDHWSGISRLRLVPNPSGGDAWWLWPAVGFAGVVLAAGIAARLWRWRQSRRGPLATGDTEPAPRAHASGGSAESIPAGATSGSTGTGSTVESVYGGGWVSQDATAGLSEKREGGLPLSDRMLFNANCDGPAAKTVKWRYDMRLTNYFWHLWDQGERDAVLLTMGVLALDAPQCAWPPDVDASEWADVIWNGTFAAVSNYVGHIEAGTLYELGYDSDDPNARMNVIPLVVWA